MIAEIISDDSDSTIALKLEHVINHSDNKTGCDNVTKVYSANSILIQVRKNYITKPNRQFLQFSQFEIDIKRCEG